MDILPQHLKYAVVEQLPELVILVIQLRPAHPLHLIIVHIMAVVMETAVKMVHTNLATHDVAVTDAVQAVRPQAQEVHHLKQIITSGVAIVIAVMTNATAE